MKQLPGRDKSLCTNQPRSVGPNVVMCVVSGFHNRGELTHNRPTMLCRQYTQEIVVVFFNLVIDLR